MGRLEEVRFQFRATGCIRNRVTNMTIVPEISKNGCKMLNRNSDIGLDNSSK